MNPHNNPSRIRAKRVMRHYFKELANSTGAILNSDAYTEIDGIIDDIIDAAVDQMRASIPEEVLAGKSYAEYFHGVKPTRSTSEPDPELGW